METRQPYIILVRDEYTQWSPYNGPGTGVCTPRYFSSYGSALSDIHSDERLEGSLPPRDTWEIVKFEEYLSDGINPHNAATFILVNGGDSILAHQFYDYCVAQEDPNRAKIDEYGNGPLDYLWEFCDIQYHEIVAQIREYFKDQPYP
jgi:hypothetical protein